MKEGYGQYLDTESNRYRGQWSEDYKHGYGEYITNDGTKYIG